MTWHNRWAQVNGRNAISWEEKFELDVWYVDNLSIILDIKIIWLTIIKVLFRGISPDNKDIMPRFDTLMIEGEDSNESRITKNSTKTRITP